MSDRPKRARTFAFSGTAHKGVLIIPGHAAFHVGNILFNGNDCKAFKPSLPPDGFHIKKFAKYLRPLMRRKEGLLHKDASLAGDCAAQANILSQIYYRDFKDKDVGEFERFLLEEHWTTEHLFNYLNKS